MTDQTAPLRDITSLPAWVQDYIRKLRKEAQDARYELKRLKAQLGK